jgi:hypothetical protein
MRITLVSFRKAQRRRTSTATRPSLRASARAFLTVVAQTPALPAMVPIGSPQRPAFAASEMMMASAVASPIVKRAAMTGGIHPKAVQARRRSREVDGPRRSRLPRLRPWRTPNGPGSEAPGGGQYGRGLPLPDSRERLAADRGTMGRDG